MDTLRALSPESRRLSSWKEIAAFFDKDVRTVRRWESERRLPVHRVPGGPRSGVYAFVAELEAWLREGSDSLIAVEAAATDGQIVPEMDGGPAAKEATPAAEVLPLASQPDLPFKPIQHELEAPPPAVIRSPRLAPTWRWGLVVMIALGLLVGTLAGWHVALRAPRPSPEHAPIVFAERESKDPAAQELYLRGRYLWNMRTRNGLMEAQDLFSQAIVRDPHFAAAFSGLADCFILLRQYGGMKDAEAFPRALAAAQSAVALDGNSPEAHRSYAFVLNYWVWDFAAAEREYRRALELNPDDAQTHHWYATSLYSAGRFEDAVREIDLARRLQPESITILANRGLLLARTDPETALTSLAQLERANPGSAYVHAMLAYVYSGRGDWKDYLEESVLAASVAGETERLPVLRVAQRELRAHGEQGMVLVLARGDGALAETGHADAMVPAYEYDRLGDRERTLFFLSMACSRREAAFLPISHDTAFGPLAGEVQFARLLTLRNTPLEPKAALGGVLPSCQVNGNSPRS